MASDWLERIKPQAAIDQGCTFQALMAIAHGIDAGTEGINVDIRPEAAGGEDTGEEAYAWMEAAYLLADLGEIPSHKIRELARAIWKGSQGELT